MLKKTAEDTILKNGQRHRIPLILMDGQQRTVAAAHTPADALILHRPGYAPISAEQQEQRRQLQARYEADVTSRWQSPSTFQNERTEGAPNKLQAYRAYQERLTSAWRGR